MRQAEEDEEQDTSRDNLIFSNFIRCASIKIQPPCRANTVTPPVSSLPVAAHLHLLPRVTAVQLYPHFLSSKRDSPTRGRTFAPLATNSLPLFGTTGNSCRPMRNASTTQGQLLRVRRREPEASASTSVWRQMARERERKKKRPSDVYVRVLLKRKSRCAIRCRGEPIGMSCINKIPGMKSY